jgi:hypothetical protein
VLQPQAVTLTSAKGLTSADGVRVNTSQLHHPVTHPYYGPPWECMGGGVLCVGLPTDMVCRDSVLECCENVSGVRGFLLLLLLRPQTDHCPQNCDPNTSLPPATCALAPYGARQQLHSCLAFWVSTPVMHQLTCPGSQHVMCQLTHRLLSEHLRPAHTSPGPGASSRSTRWPPSKVAALIGNHHVLLLLRLQCHSRLLCSWLLAALLSTAWATTSTWLSMVPCTCAVFDPSPPACPFISSFIPQCLCQPLIDQLLLLVVAHAPLRVLLLLLFLVKAMYNSRVSPAACYHCQHNTISPWV